MRSRVLEPGVSGGDWGNLEDDDGVAAEGNPHATGWMSWGCEHGPRSNGWGMTNTEGQGCLFGARKCVRAWEREEWKVEIAAGPMKAGPKMIEIRFGMVMLVVQLKIVLG